MSFFANDKRKKAEFSEQLKESFSSWKNEVQEFNKPFFAIHSDFKHLFLKDLSGGAVKLFIFLGLHSKYQTGESWYSASEVSSFFGKDSRTISNWFKELEDVGLIVREQMGFKMKANTFLRPYGFLIDIIENNHLQSTYDDVVKNVTMQPVINYKLDFGLLLNYSFKEYTVLLIHRNNNMNSTLHNDHQKALFRVSCIQEFNPSDIPKLRLFFKNQRVQLDNFDIDFPVSSSKYKKLTVYSYLNKYFDNEGGNIQVPNT